MKKYGLGLILLVIVIGYLVLKPKTDISVSPISPITTESLTVLPPSFTMEIEGDFNDPTIEPTYEGGISHDAFLISSGGEELLGESYYTYAVPGTNGHLISCTIEDGKWITSQKPPKVCQALSRIATTRTALMQQIADGTLVQVHDESCTQLDKLRLCYKLK